MNLLTSELKRLLELLAKSNALIKKAPSRYTEQEFHFNENLFSKLSIEFAKKTIAITPDDINEKILNRVTKSKILPDYKRDHFAYSTSDISKLLKIKESDLRVYRTTKDLKEGIHYEKGRAPKTNAFWYDIDQTCQMLHEVTFYEFSRPGFDVQKNSEEITRKAFERARSSQKK